MAHADHNRQDQLLGFGKNRFSLRYASATDVAAIGRIQVTTWRDAYRDLIPDDILANITSEKIEVFVTEILSGLHEGTFVLVCEMGMCPAGFCIGGPERREREERGSFGEIYSMYVLPAYQRLGLGKALLCHAAELLGSNGMTALSLWVLRGNKSALRFYQSMGGVMEETKQFEAFGTTLVVQGIFWEQISDVADRADLPSRPYDG